MDNIVMYMVTDIFGKLVLFKELMDSGTADIFMEDKLNQTRRICVMAKAKNVTDAVSITIRIHLL